MTARQRAPPPASNRPNNVPYNYSRPPNSDDRDALFSDPHGDRGYVSTLRGGSYIETGDASMLNQYSSYRSRTESNASLPVDAGRMPRSQITSNADDSKGRGPSLSASPNRIYRDDGRPRSGPSTGTASSREKLYYGTDDFQPPQFPHNPFVGSRQSIALENQDPQARRSRPNSRTASPIPGYPSTPPPTQHRFDSSTPEHGRPRTNTLGRSVQGESDPRLSEHPYQLPPLKFSPPRTKDPYDFLSVPPLDETDPSPEMEAVKHSPPVPSRPPPPPPPRQNLPAPQNSVEHLSPSIPWNPSNDGPDALARISTNKDGAEEWTLENVIEFLRQNGFGEAWQQAFRDADIHGEKFRACASFPEAKKLVHVPQEAQQPQHGRTLFKLITIIRKVLNPDSDTPDSETSTPTSRSQEHLRRASDHEKRPFRRETTPNTVTPNSYPVSNPSLPSPDSPVLPPLSSSTRPGPRQKADRYTTFATPPIRYEVPPKLQPPPAPRVRSPQDAKRPLSPNVGDIRPPHASQGPFLGQYNRHSKNISTDSNISDQSLRSLGHPTRSSQDFQEVLQRLGKDGAIAPQKRLDKKKSHEQMSKPGLFQRFFQRDKSKEIVADVEEPELDYPPLPSPLPPQPPYNQKTSGMNNSQSSLESSSLSTPIDDPRFSLTTSVSSLPSARPVTEPSTPYHVLPSVLWVQITQDGEDFRRCDLSHISPDAVTIREIVCQKFGLKSKDTALFVTDIDGTPEGAEELDDDALLSACSRGDAKGTVKFLLKGHVGQITMSPGKMVIAPVPSSLRPAQGGKLIVPESGRDVRAGSISEDPNRNSHYTQTAEDLYGPGSKVSGEGEDVKGNANTLPTDKFCSFEDGDKASRRESNVPLNKGDVNTRVFEAAERAKRNREGRKRTESGGSEKSTPVEEHAYQVSGDTNPLVSPTTRRRPSAQEDSGFEKLWGGKGISQSARQPSRQGSLPLSPVSAGGLRLISKDGPDNFVDFEKSRYSPYTPSKARFELSPLNQHPQPLPTRTPSGIKPQRKAPAPPQFPLPPSRTSTVVASQKISEKSLPRIQHSRRSSDGQNTARRSIDDTRFIPRGPSEFAVHDSAKAMTQDPSRPYNPHEVASLVSKANFVGGFIPMVAPTIVGPSHGRNLEPPPVKRAPSPGTPGARLGITVNTDLGRHTSVESPPTEWRTSLSPYSAFKPSPSTRDVEQPAAPKPSEPTTAEPAEIDSFKESADISFDDAPAFDLPEDDEEGSLWAVKPVGVGDGPNAHSLRDDKPSPPLLRKKSSLRQAGKVGAKLKVQIDENNVTEIPTPHFSAIAEETPTFMVSSIPSQSVNSASEDRNSPDHRSESPEYTIGDDLGGLNSPIRGPPSPGTPSATSYGTTTTDLTRKSSFAKHEDGWAVRPPPELVLDNLEEFFPNHDLDKPIVVDHGNLSPPVSPLENSDSDGTTSIKPQTPLKRQPHQFITSTPPAPYPKPATRMKSIRVLAKEAIEQRNRFATIAKGVKNANLLRRRSTKVWGAKMLEMTPGQVILGQIVTADSEERTFKWVKGELIGKGTYGSVYLGLNATTGDMLAVKEVDVSRGISDHDDERCKAMVDALNAEIETLKDLDHPHIVQYLGYQRTDKTLSIFLEYVPGGSVGRCLKKHGRFEESVIRSLIRQTLEGLAYLHSQRRLHRDLKADNLLLDLDGTCKISDFGISKQSKDVYANDHYTLAGTIFWMAPEVIQSRKEGYSAKIDIWSLGCVVLEMFAGKRPWSTDEAVAAMLKLGVEKKAPPIPDDVLDHMSSDAKDFLDKCFTIEAADRPTAAVLLSHPFCVYDPKFKFSETKLGKAVRFGQK